MIREGFNVFLTGDRNLQFQQDLPRMSISVIILSGTGTRLVDTMPLMPKVMAALATVRSGMVTTVC